MNTWMHILSTRGDHGNPHDAQSASTQVSIDYLNEQDFCKKFQLAQMLSPVLALLTSTAVIDERFRKLYIPRTEI